MTHAIGTKFKKRDIRKDDYEVIDIYETRNSKGELMGTEYLCVHDFCGQPVKTLELGSTISRGIIGLPDIFDMMGLEPVKELKL